jgi:Holliday junction resolvasome RuvABC ATP-dependent DNA helicase subunit
MNFPYITCAYTDLVPIPSNNYTVFVNYALEEEVRFQYKTKTYDRVFALLIRDESKQNVNIVGICNFISYKDNELTFYVICRGLLTRLAPKYLEAEEFEIESSEETGILIKRIIDSYLNLNCKEKILPILNGPANIETLNKMADLLLVIDSDRLLYFKSNNIRERLYLLYEYYDIAFNFVQSNKNTIDLSLYPPLVQEKIKAEQKLLKNYPPSSQEAAKINEYLETLKKIPWGKKKKTLKDFIEIQDLVNVSHYGLEDIKTHILDLIAYEKLIKTSSTDCILFLGPPGTGKTSFAKSLAEILEREYIYISMAGLSDESEIRGHRRTYIGSKPGRIVTSLSKGKTMNPVVVLDEIDKITTTKSNPEYALLELLDPEQNKAFFDRYLEVPIDLSECIFICTANEPEALPAPLRDRLDVVLFKEYNTYQKQKIISEYLLPSIFQLTKVKLNLCDLEADLILHLASRYNLRDIKRYLVKITRRNAKAHYLQSPKVKDLEGFLLNFNQTNTNKKGIGF